MTHAKELLYARNTREDKEPQKQTQNKKMVIETYILIVTLNEDGLNAPSKRHRLSGWMQK